MDSAISTVLSCIPNVQALKYEQMTALKAFVGGEDVFAFLPTGFGKSLSWLHWSLKPL